MKRAKSYFQKFMNPYCFCYLFHKSIYFKAKEFQFLIIFSNFA
jgi:hypothetical protein